MVRTKKALHRAAFTLIELIFAIIIMSIAIVSLPMMMQINSDGVERGILQEAIFAASAELMGATTYYWDGRSTEDFNLSKYSRVVDVDGDCNADRQRLRSEEHTS
ncbi:MAG: type II secretion system protein, partial [Sulfurimonas sp.]